jgi:hypothetical protein
MQASPTSVPSPSPTSVPSPSPVFRLKRRSRKGCFVIDEYATLAESTNPMRLDAVLVLTMSSSDRMAQLWEQLQTQCPHASVFVFTNPGFRNCSKRLCQQRPDFDLLDAYKTMFEFALGHKFRRVVTFEDDFFWSSLVNNGTHFTRIGHFLDTYGNSIDHYFLGCIPMLSVPTGFHWRLFSAGGTHAVVHTERGMHTYLREYPQLCERCDEHSCTIDLYFTSFAIVYGYCLPLAYQTFPITQMQKQAWPPLCSFLMRTFTNLDTHVHPWYDVFYALQIVPLLIIAVAVCVAGYVCTRRARIE